MFWREIQCILIFIKAITKSAYTNGLKRSWFLCFNQIRIAIRTSFSTETCRDEESVSGANSGSDNVANSRTLRAGYTFFTSHSGQVSERNVFDECKPGRLRPRETLLVVFNSLCGLAARNVSSKSTKKPSIRESFLNRPVSRVPDTGPPTVVFVLSCVDNTK